MGLAGAVIVISQFLSNFQSSQTVSSEIVKFKEEFQESIVDREKFFVRKTDISPVLAKLDLLNVQLVKLNEKVSSLKRAVKENNSFEEAYLDGAEGGDIVGCVNDIFAQDAVFTAELRL